MSESPPEHHAADVARALAAVADGAAPDEALRRLAELASRTHAPAADPATIARRAARAPWPRRLLLPEDGGICTRLRLWLQCLGVCGLGSAEMALHERAAVLAAGAAALAGASRPPTPEIPPPVDAAAWLTEIHAAWLRRGARLHAPGADGAEIVAEHPEDKVGVLAAAARYAAVPPVAALWGAHAAASSARLRARMRATARHGDRTQAFAMDYLFASAAFVPLEAPLIEAVLGVVDPLERRAIAEGLAEQRRLLAQRRAPARRRAARLARAAERLLHVRVTLRGLRPVVTRDVALGASTRLRELHRVIQALFGWEDGHHHRFAAGDTHSGWPDWTGEDEGLERGIALGDAIADAGGSLLYLYDFGDNWEHEVTVRGELQADGRRRPPWLIAARRACPPEDCGGAFAYGRLLADLASADRRRRQRAHDVLGKRFDPELVDQARIERALAKLARSRRR